MPRAVPRAVSILLMISVASLELYWLGVTRCEVAGASSFEHDILLSLDAQNAVGQTFRTSRDGLCRIRMLVIVPDESSESTVHLNVQEAGRNGQDILVQSLTDVKSGWLDVHFPPQPGPEQGFHFYLLSGGDTEDVRVAAARKDPYTDGRAYGRGVPEDYDLRFEFFYARDGKERLRAAVLGEPRSFGRAAAVVIAFAGYNALLAFLLIRVVPSLFGVIQRDSRPELERDTRAASDTHA